MPIPHAPLRVALALPPLIPELPLRIPLYLRPDGLVDTVGVEDATRLEGMTFSLRHVAPAFLRKLEQINLVVALAVAHLTCPCESLIRLPDTGRFAPTLREPTYRFPRERCYFTAGATPQLLAQYPAGTISVRSTSRSGGN